MEELSDNRKAIILLHEIYGINEFIKNTCKAYRLKGFDVYCPDMLRGMQFDYSNIHKAYEYFFTKIGFDVYKEIDALIDALAEKYCKVYILGFSIGATIAFRCCENDHLDGIICCYGSRIRDYLDMKPSCPALLLLAEEDSFDVGIIIDHLKAVQGMSIYRLQADHGFMDAFSEHYNETQSRIANGLIEIFFKKLDDECQY